MGQSRCVQCQKWPVDPRWQPFCSERCRLIDLSRWLDGSYRVPGEPVETTTIDDTADDDE